MSCSPTAAMTRWQALACVAAIWAAIYLPGLGSLEIKGEEGRRLLPAVSMLETGRWVVPTIGGMDYLAKPPLINWLAAAAFAVAGDTHNEWAARAPSVLAVLALGLGTVGALGCWLGNAGALLAAVFLLTNIGLMEKGRLAEIEALYLSLTGLAIVLWLGAWRRDVVERNGKPSWRAWTLPWVFLGLGMLTKGPLHLLFFYAVVSAVLVFAGRRRDWWNGPHLAGVVIMLAIFAAWAVPYLRQTAAGHSGGVWFQQLQGRLEVNDKFHLGAWLLNIPRGLANYLPWTVLLPLAWRRGQSIQANPADAVTSLDHAIARGLRWALGGCFLAVSLAPGGQPRYTLPLLTPASVLLALALTRAWRLPAWLPVVWRRLTAVCLLGAAGAAPIAAALGGSDPWRWAFGVVAMAAGSFAFIRLWRERGAGELASIALASAAAMALITADYVTGAIPRLRRTESVRLPAEQIDRVLAAGGLEERPVVLRPGFLPFLFYLRHRPVYVQTANEVPSSARYLLVRKDDEPDAAEVLRKQGAALRMILPVKDNRTRGTDHEGWLLERLESPAEHGL